MESTVDKNRYIEQLKRHLYFINKSCESFDNGTFIEGTRISVSLRVLFHDTNRSTSLLNHLNCTDINILSTVRYTEFSENDCIRFYDPMIGFKNYGESPGLYPNCYNEMFNDEYVFLPRAKWWNQIVRVIGDLKLSRKQIVLTLADQDGGAHVDSTVEETYQYANTAIKVIHKYDDGTEIEGFNEASLIIMRQLGYEVLNSPDISTALIQSTI